MVMMLFRILPTVKQQKVIKNIPQLIKALFISLAVKKTVIASSKAQKNLYHNLVDIALWVSR